MSPAEAGMGYMALLRNFDEAGVGDEVAARGERVDLHGFADGVFRHGVRAGASVIREVDRFVRRVGEVGHGTRIADSIRATWRGHGRVIVISDMQTFAPGRGTGEVTEAVPRCTGSTWAGTSGPRSTRVPRTGSSSGN
ncbi:hypothetical protein [Micromonospora echinofusca]|uniref:Uncharacterized protein n=1 Tax=Micromonospora echinofusca TaxID=47858 RepID=A0ABS3VZV0_MICEH|nr:hypothetical protein [Micromonospora echinofusca]MBO4209968.1 hypothetical protein [Micromonospora echinofusca]